MDYYWTEERIRLSYSRAMFPKAQIHILADLCECDTDYIKAVVGLIPEATKEHKKRPDGRINGVDTAKISDMLMDLGNTFTYIATCAGCSRPAVRKVYLQNKYKFPTRIERQSRDDERVIKYLMNPYLTTAQVAKYTGYSSTTVRSIAAKYKGIVPPRRSRVGVK